MGYAADQSPWTMDSAEQRLNEDGGRYGDGYEYVCCVVGRPVDVDVAGTDDE